jgi:hypothetical protein
VHSKFFQSDWSSDLDDEKPSGFFTAIFSALKKNYRIFPKKNSHAEIFSEFFLKISPEYFLVSRKNPDPLLRRKIHGITPPPKPLFRDPGHLQSGPYTGSDSPFSRNGAQWEPGLGSANPLSCAKLLEDSA